MDFLDMTAVFPLAYELKACSCRDPEFMEKIAKRVPSCFITSVP
jgi:hypothetical protein